MLRFPSIRCFKYSLVRCIYVVDILLNFLIMSLFASDLKGSYILILLQLTKFHSRIPQLLLRRWTQWYNKRQWGHIILILKKLFIFCNASWYPWTYRLNCFYLRSYESSKLLVLHFRFFIRLMLIFVFFGIL